ncbi:hypothetical protein E2C01_088319 [Portunus trituberculatus]|uniref:Uncharacterized protein n=1 Tax=Portunus trituberculatus TaxID=210409 RepID=A0A5B7JG97_PORTR|nr:hypothetical protein [Portunus trituberculatus]
MSGKGHILTTRVLIQTLPQGPQVFGGAGQYHSYNTSVWRGWPVAFLQNQCLAGLARNTPTTPVFGGAVP